MNGMYWGLTALCTMGRQDALPRDEMIEFVMSCWDEEAGKTVLRVHDVLCCSDAAGAFGAHPDHDAHVLSTLSAIQILVTQDAMDKLDVERITKCLCSLCRAQ